MGKSSKAHSQPNAPQLEQLLPTRQPPLNPYYPSWSEPYPELAPVYSQQPPTIVVQTPIRDYRMERYHRKVRKFGIEVSFVGIIAAIAYIVAHELYSKRTCINYLVYKPSSDVTVMYSDVKDYQNSMALLSLGVLVLASIRCLFTQRGHSLYVFLNGLLLFVAAFSSGVLAYLALYSPCKLDVETALTGLIKTGVGSIMDKTPRPDIGFFSEKNVFETAEQDGFGVGIFFLDLSAFLLFLSAFFSSIC